MENKTQRNAGVDLLRIISMYFAVMLHIQKQGGIIDNTELFSLHNAIMVFYHLAAYCSVNCFGMVSGYAMLNAGFKLKNLIYLWMQVLFYSFGITFLAAVSGYMDPDRAWWIKSIFPVSNNQYWYFTAYFGMMFIAPAAIYAIKHIPQKTLSRILVSVAIVMSVVGKLTHTDPFMLQGGYSISWLVIMFFFGGYLRKYGAFSKWSSRKLFMGYLGFVALSVILEHIAYLPQYFYCPALEKLSMMSYRAPTVLGAAVMLFLWCERLTLNQRMLKMIKFLSPLSFGVYLIHVHPVVYSKITGLFQPYVQLSAWGLAITVPLTAAAIYIICTLVDWLRFLLFKILRLEKAAGWIAERLTTMADSIGKICE